MHSVFSHLVEVTEQEVTESIRVIPHLGTLILVKAMGRKKHFGRFYWDCEKIKKMAKIQEIHSGNTETPKTTTITTSLCGQGGEKMGKNYKNN